MGGAALCPAAVAALACAAAVRAQPEGGAPFRRVFTADGGLAATWFDASYKGASTRRTVRERAGSPS